MALPIDVSKAWFIFTANTLEGIPTPVLDRLSVFRMEAYTLDDMQRIVRKVIAGRNARSSRPEVHGKGRKPSGHLTLSCHMVGPSHGGGGREGVRLQVRDAA